MNPSHPGAAWIAACFVVIVGLGTDARCAVLQVRPGESVAAAVQAAHAGDTVRVARGAYTEHVTIDKALVLQGVGMPTLGGAHRGDVIRVRAADVTIEGFVVRDSGTDLGAQNAGIYIEPGSDHALVRDCELVANLFGVWLENSADSTLQHNVIIGRSDLQSVERGNGIQVYNTSNSRIIDNEVSYTRDGIYVDYSRHALFRGNRIHHVRYGTHYMNTNDSTWENNEVYQNHGGLALMEVRNLVVRNNVAWGNENHGIMLRTIQDSVIENNVVAGNGLGFFIYDAEYNTVRNNLVIRNRIGIHLTAGSIHNAFNGNDFIGNQEQVKFVATHDVEWGRDRGNYWSNYGGWDQDGDGIGDIVYEANDVVDRLNWQYPLVKLLLNSPAIQTLRFVARQFPVLRAPSVIDKHPRMRPWHRDWSKWNDK